MNLQVFADKRFLQKLSTVELIGLSVTGILVTVLIAELVFRGVGAAFLLWHIPSVIFATIAVSAIFVLVRREQPFTFKQASGIIAIGVAVTSIVTVPLAGWMFEIPFDLVFISSFIPHYYALYVVPVMIMFLLGAAQTSRQLLVSSLLLIVTLLALVVSISEPWRQFQMSVFYCLNLLLGFPLTVLSHQYSSR